MPHTILIVDDDPDDIALTERILVKTGRDLELVSALDGETALTLLRNEDDLPALILVDLKMPGMNGIDLLHRIHADDRLKDIPVIMITNSKLESDQKAAMDAGAAVFLHKVLDLRRFGREIERELSRWLDR